MSQNQQPAVPEKLLLVLRREGNREDREDRESQKREKKKRERGGLLDKKSFITVLVFGLVLGVPSSRLQAAYAYPAVVFTDNVSYFSPDLNLYIQSCQAGADKVDFTFHNQYSANSCTAQIYFEATAMLASASKTIGPNTVFPQPSKPHNVPAARLLEPVNGSSPFFFRQQFSFVCKPIEPRLMASDYLQFGRWLQH